MEGSKELQIKPTLDEHLHERSTELVEYIKDSERKPDTHGNDEFENTFTKPFTDHREGHLDNALARLEIAPQSDLHEQITGALAEVDTQIDLTDDVIRSSPTVSVYRQQRLYDYMLAKIKEKGPEYLMPVHPMHKDAYESLAAIFKRCHNHIFQWKKEDKRHRRAAVFALPWMKGLPLPQIIDDHFQWASKNRSGHQIKNSILETLQAIEEDVRFTYVRLTGCYNTLLKRALIETGHADMVERIVPIPLFLEVGACSQTMMSLIGLGLSRITSRKLTEAAARHNFGTAEAKNWLRRQNLEVLGVSPIIINEIRRMVV